jgi:hypothetical protein
MKDGKRKILMALEKGVIFQKQQAKLRRIEYYNNPVLCKFCNGSIKFENRKKGKFCSQSCNAAFNNKGVRRRGQAPGNCLECGTKKETYKYNFCSKECFGLFRTKMIISEWLKTKTSQNNKELSRTIRLWLIKEAKEKCSKCGWNIVHTITKSVPLQINHKDGNWANNAPENLEVLCPNCHALTENFGALNLGNGRKHCF